MDREQLLTDLIRISEGAASALKNRSNDAELEANLTFVKANVRHALQLLGSPEAGATT